MAKSFFERFVEWQNYVHYFLLTIAVIFIFSYIDSLNIDLLTNIFIKFVSVTIIDSLVHGLFWILPKPIKWRD